MARKIKEIEARIESEMTAKELSTSAVAEWKLWSTVIAAVIHSFEVIMDMFRKEIEERTDKAIPGTLRWYADICRKWQMGDTLQYDPDTSQVSYPQIVPDKQLISAISVTENLDTTAEDRGTIAVKAAKGPSGSLQKLDENELFSFSQYVDMIKFAGDKLEVISKEPDTATYKINVYTDGKITPDALKEGVKAALDAYCRSLEFNGTIHVARIVNAVLDVEGVVTADMVTLTLHTSGGGDTNVTSSATCTAGYFNFTHEEQSIIVKS